MDTDEASVSLIASPAEGQCHPRSPGKGASQDAQAFISRTRGLNFTGLAAVPILGPAHYRVHQMSTLICVLYSVRRSVVCTRNPSTLWGVMSSIKSCNSQKCSISLLYAVTQWSNNQAPKYVARAGKKFASLPWCGLGVQRGVQFGLMAWSMLCLLGCLSLCLGPSLSHCRELTPKIPLQPGRKGGEGNTLPPRGLLTLRSYVGWGATGNLWDVFPKRWEDSYIFLIARKLENASMYVEFYMFFKLSSVIVTNFKSGQPFIQPISESYWSFS